MSVLYVVATPLGHLGDLSPRGQQVMREVHTVYAEDTRRTSSLLRHFGIARHTESLHAHNEAERIGQILRVLGNGKSVALVSDAGTPTLSDPGAGLVAAALAAGFRVSPVPGPSALSAALSISGFCANNSLFLGFLPTKGRERRRVLDRASGHDGVVVLFEAPHRIRRTLSELAHVQGERPARLLRELTKVYEEIRVGSIRELSEGLDDEIRGEITLVLGPWDLESKTVDDEHLKGALRRCFQAGFSTRDSAAAVAAILEHPRRSVYALAQRLKDR